MHRGIMLHRSNANIGLKKLKKKFRTPIGADGELKSQHRWNFNLSTEVNLGSAETREVIRFLKHTLRNDKSTHSRL